MSHFMDLRRPSVVAIGASAGGIDALFGAAAGLRPGFGFAAIFILHQAADGASRLASVLGTRLGIPTREAQSHAPAEAGVLHVAPPGYHLLLEADRTFSLSCEPPVLFSRPSIDVLFQSCADACGRDVAGVLLSGANEDGAEGLAAIGEAGGITLVQDPAQAQHPVMPAAAIARRMPDAVLRLADLRALLARWGEQA